MSALQRFLDAQDKNYTRAWSELREGRKQSHWMWYIFPQIAGLGQSETSKYYAIRDFREAEEYIRHPVLGRRLIDMSRLLLMRSDEDIRRLLGSPDDQKLRSSMTLFSLLPGADQVFQDVLDRFFGGSGDHCTRRILAKEKN